MRYAVSAARPCLFLWILLCLLPGFTAKSAVAQVSGQFYGTVTDASGAAVPGARVVLTDNGKGSVRETATDKNGSFEFLAVPVAENYTLSAEAPLFEKSLQSGFRLEVNQRYRVDFTLKVGKAADTVSVAASGLEVESSSTQLGDVIQDKKIESLPLNGRSYLDLLGLQTGVAPVSNPSPFQPQQVVSGDLTSGELSVNGQRENANAFLVNGAIAEDNGSNGAGVVPVLDSLQEFRLLTSTYDAEFGNFSGAIVNVITKSGSNALHGSAFEFLRNTDLDAASYFAAGERGTLKRNQFGGTLGGPVLKDRLFFFLDYQGTRQNQGLATFAYVPTAAQLTGDLSSAVAALLGSTPGATSNGVRGDNLPGHLAATLSQRLGYAVTAGEPYFATGCTSVTACVFPNGIIPQAAWSPAAQGLLKFIPAATGPASGSNPFAEYNSNSFAETVADNKFGTRVDLATHNGTDNWSMYYHFDDAAVKLPFGASNTFGTATNIPGFAYSQPSRAQLAVLSNTLIFGADKVNEAHLSYHRVAFPGPTPSEGLGKVSSYGFNEGGLGLIPANPAIEGVPEVILNGQLGGLTMGAAITDGSFQNNIQAQDGFSWVVGKHTMKFGGEFTHKIWYRRGGPVPNGQFVFGGGESGIDFADFLIGAPDQFVQSSKQTFDGRSKAGGAYFQDSVRMRPDLTLNYGVRWEFAEPWSETRGRIQAFVPGQQSTVFANSPTGWVFPGDKGIPSSLGYTRWNNFSPRLGAAYTPVPSTDLMRRLLGDGGKTSFRAAIGRFFTTMDTTGGDFETGDAPFGLYYGSPSLIYLDTPFKGRATGTDPGQRFPFVQPTQNGSFAAFLPISYSSAFYPGNVSPYAIQYNLTVQRELAKSTLVSIGYVGSVGRHLFQLQEFNPGNPATCLKIAALYAAANQPGGCGPGGEDTIYSINGQTFNGTRPFSVTSGNSLNIGELDFGTNPYNITNGVSSYNSLQVTVDKRVGAARVLGAYTWAKSLDDASSFSESVNPYNSILSYGLSTFDIKQNFVVSYSYDLPFGHWLPTDKSLAGKALNGWTLVGITRFTGGFPVLLQETDDRSLCGCDGQGIHALDLPNYNGQGVKKFNPRSTPGVHQYFDTSNFSQMALGVPGNANRSFFHGPGINNSDASLHKLTPLTERLNMEFRVEFFNIFNHAQFLAPGGNFASGNFGQVSATRDPRIGQGAVRFVF